MDERIDMIRAVRNERYVYIRNYMPHLIYGQHVAYMFITPTTRIWQELYDAGKLRPPQTYFWERKPPEDLYDLQSDPDEVKNLANSPEHRAILEQFRKANRQHALEIRDVGFLSEAEQHRRVGNSTMYELGHNPQKYALEKILAMAELASGLKPDALPQLKAGLKSDDSGVRYWAAMGILMRGAGAVGPAREELRAAVSDESPSVCVVAARALGQFGNDDDLKLALPALRELAPPDKNGEYVLIETLNAIDALGPKALPLLGFLRTMPHKEPAAVDRVAESLPVLFASIMRNQHEKSRTTGK
jgi:uncharacterized sulfatase